MPTITFIDYEGNETIVDGELDQSVMIAATENDVPGIDADCGGACACATCHVYVHEEWLDVVGQRNESEDDLLKFANNVEDNSRLSCQMDIDESFDGLVVTTPESQH